MLRPQGYAALTFDCYGTLIDWRAGLLAAVKSCTGVDGLDPDQFLTHREEEENRLEAGEYLPYRQVVAGSVTRALARQGMMLPEPEAEAVAASVGGWQPFADVPAALARLAEGRSLAIVSNVERRDIELSAARLGVSFAAIVTAEDVESYKPARPHFDQVLERLSVPRGRLLHVAQSLYHDIRPAHALGIDTVWINRLGEPLPDDVTPTAQFPDLASLADALRYQM